MTWENAWQEGRTKWDAGQSPPALVSLIESGVSGGKGRALVTGCGSGYDVFSLADVGYQALGMDLAPTAAKKFHELREARGLSTKQADIMLADFFACVSLRLSTCDHRKYRHNTYLNDEIGR